MQKFTQKWCLVKLLEPVQEGAEFFWKDWPLHVTLADVLAVDWEATKLFEKLSALLAARRPVKVVAGDDEYFGSSENPVQVTILNKSDELQSLHDDIVDLLENAGVVFNKPEYTKKGFVAHSTVQKHARLHKGDVIKIDELTIVDMFPNGNGEQRKVLKTIKFSPE